MLIPPSSLTVRFLESVELLISRLGSVARVIIFLQMLVWEGTKREVREGGEREKKQLPPLPVPPQHEVIYSSLPEAPKTTSSTPLCWISPPLLPLSFCPTHSASLDPRRQPGQAVFTAEVIGVVWREPDLGPAKA